jgi:hypothetical protein
MLTRQEIFDKVAMHLLTQRERSRANGDTGSCMYRGSGGRRCAAGVLIPDAVYGPRMEHNSFRSLASDQTGFLDACGIERADVPFVQALQNVHDETEPSDWAHALKGAAAVWGLSHNVLSHFPQEAT